MRHETYLPPQQIEAKEKIWISRPYENGRGAKSDSPPPQSGSKSSFGLARSDRLRKRADFLRTSRQGKRLVGKFLCIDVRRAPRLRFGITASKKYGDAPERNRFKRLVRETFRLEKAHLPLVECNIFPRERAKTAMQKDISQEILHLLNPC